jgi:cobalamin-dependent methionine synthase I
MRFHFPRQPYDDHLALSDYYATVESGQMDVVALQVVTVGLEATEKFEKMQAANDYTEAYFTHGLAVQTAEATANYLHEHIRRELGLSEDQGKRYSWGYPAIPELEDHFKVFKLLARRRNRTRYESCHFRSTHPRTIHCRDHCPPQGCEVLQRSVKAVRAASNN